MFDLPLSQKYEKYISALLAILFSVGLLAHVYGLEKEMLVMTEGFILFCNIIVTVMLLWTSTAAFSKINYQFFVWILAVFAITLWIEIYGVATGLIFGAYQYGNVFRFKLLEVPWIIGWNWVLIIFATTLIWRDLVVRFTEYFTKPYLMAFTNYKESWNPWIDLGNNFVIALSAGVTAVLFDWILEPVAIHYNYWTWAGVSVPIKNYVAWFTITFLVSIILMRFDVKFKSRLIKDYLFFQTVFFVGLLLNIII